MKKVMYVNVTLHVSSKEVIKFLKCPIRKELKGWREELKGVKPKMVILVKVRFYASTYEKYVTP